jgi:hypothetical protein
MKAIKKLSPEQRELLLQIETIAPEKLSVDDIMALGGNRLIEFTKGKGFKLTKRGHKALEAIKPEE